MELPGWGTMLRVTGVMTREGWQNGPTRILRCKNNGYLVSLDLSNWSERLSYFLGRYHEIATAMFLQTVVRPGDTFIDIGANVGLITLHAAALVGPAGRVHSFEPNPHLVDRLGKLIALNKLNHVTLHPVGLSDTEGELALSILKDHHEQGTLSYIDDPTVFSQQYHVPIRLGDGELPVDLPGPAMIKIDVEGHEPHVLRGLRRTLDRLRPVVFTEVSDDYLRRAGSSVAELFEFMHSLGYRGHQIKHTRRMFRRRLRLVKVLDPVKVVDENIAWLHPQSPRGAEMAELVR